MPRLAKSPVDQKETGSSTQRAVAALGVIVFGLLVVARWTSAPGESLADSGVDIPCPFQGLFSVACPLCGGTRAFYKLAHGDLIGAVSFAPGPGILILVTLLLGGAALVAELSGRTLISPARGPRLFYAAALGLLCAWPLVLMRGDFGP